VEANTKPLHLLRMNADQLWEALFCSSAIPMCIVQRNSHRIIDANASYEHLTGYHGKELGGRFLSDIEQGDEPHHPRVSALWKGYVTRDLLVNIRTKDGERRSMYRTIKQIECNGEACALVSYFDRDITLRQGESALRDSEERFRMLFEASPDSIVLIDPHDPDLPWRIVDANEAACRLNGYQRHELIGLSNNQLRVEADWIPCDAFLDALRAGPVHGFDTHRRKDGSTVPTEFSATLVHVGGRELVLGINRDITERLQVEEALRSNEEYLRAVVENGADVIAVLEPEGTVRYLSPSFERVFGTPPHEHIGVPGFSFVDPSDMPRAEALFARLLTHPGQTTTTELRVKHPDGSPRTVEIAANNMSTHPVVRGIVINAHDVTERRRMEQQLIHDASHDALTGLPNRLLFFDRLAKALARSAQEPQRQCAVLFLDLDRFKTINDSMGHGVGDQLLMAVSKRLEQCLRPNDTVARFGGDEFAILLEDLDDPAFAANIAERICTAVEAPYMIAGLEMVMSASVGIALSGMTEMQPEELLRDADIAMYRAKRLGRGRYATVDPAVHVMLKDRLQMEADLRRALERDEFELYYQPKVAIDGVRIVGLEALIRWRHPERGLVSPAEFIPVAEDTGLIVPLGAWVLRTACTQLKAWHDQGLPRLYVAVNLSAVQFRRPDIAQSIRAIIEETGLEPRYVALELTESILMEDVATTSEALQHLRAIDIGHVSVDDFGTGYSSLSYLQRFPISTIKIDRSFVNDVTTNPGSSAIAAAIIALAHSLQLVTVAEGVETEDQLRWLQDHGCDAFQGYLFSPPLPVQGITRLLASTAVVGA
jgi:diguanylate cyclase (GGDEF)-like protein/PAS domain S-box-containing protein